MPSRRPTSAPGRTRWELNAEAFDRLLAAFDPDREEASHRYEALRRRLIDLFAWERSEWPEDRADETLNRLARRLAEGVSVDSGLARYAFGIARLLLHEERRARRQRDAAVRDWTPPHIDAETGEALDLLRECVDALPPESRSLIARYYAEDRASLATAFGLSVNALRNRALRIRDLLAACVSRKRDV